MNIFNTMASGLVQHILGSGVFSKPTGIAFGLTTVPPTNTSVTEAPNTGGYARVNYGQNTTSFNAVNALWSFPIEGSGIAYNNLPISFPVVVSPGIGMVSGAFMSDSSAYGGGSYLSYCNLPFAKDLQQNDQLVIGVSGAQVRFY